MAGLLVLWDIDYTLVNAGGASRRLYQVVFRELFGRELDHVAPMAGRTDRAIVADTLALAGIGEPDACVDDFLAALAARSPGLRAQISRGGQLLPGAAAALAAVADLARAGPDGDGGRARTVQSVLTGNVRPIAEAKLTAFGLDAYLDLEIGAYGDHHEVRAELVYLARRQACLAYGLDFAGRSTVLVGDTPHDVAAAQASGARAVAVATGGSSAAELAGAGADVVLPGLTDTRAVVAAVLGTG